VKKEIKTNIVWQDTTINRSNREILLKQKGILLWFTGLSGSGKSTIANALEKKLHENNKFTYLLDGDNVRHGLNSDLNFSLIDRKENIRRISELAKLFVDAGIITIATFISPLKEDRGKVRELIKEDFIEIFVDCSLDSCEQRDPKGLYKKAKAGLIKDFTGIDSPYEIPNNPEISVNSDSNTVDECAEVIISYLKLRNILQFEVTDDAI